MSESRSIPQKFWKTFSSVATGIVLLILVVITSAAGTLILQRPLTEPEQMQRAYSPAVLRWLDVAQLTDVFHSWWFIALLGLLCLNIVLASIDRFPGVWRYFSRPYRRPDAHFLTGLPLHAEIP
ncbi:MAG: cytochrome c biogenesis protein ResB, partial [Acidobacteria bacterium]|nr:cytochrome c biogenesis protein ResB [Acidobacteriota bacterium]